MIKYFKGTVFNVETDAKVNTVNCVGVMSAGIALEFKLRYPQMFDEYKTKCDNKLMTTGKVDYYHGLDVVIINFPTKQHFRYPSKLEWIEQALIDFVRTHKDHHIQSVAFPKLGTGQGGLNWNEVKKIMEKYLSNLDIDVYICLDELKEAQGVEKAMLDKFNSINLYQLSDKIKLNQTQIKNLMKERPYHRFWHIEKTDSIGIKTYSKLFTYFYNNINNQNEEMNLFDLL